MNVSPSHSKLNSESNVTSFETARNDLVTQSVKHELVRLSIDNISEYEFNPRHERNSAYEAIKMSIRAKGLLQPLTVTQRPGESHYLIKNGGNTRLRILKELCTESEDKRFAYTKCLFEPWGCESEVLAAHLIENEMRGDLTFIDKARAVCKIKCMLDSELGISLSQRELVKRLKDLGYRTDSPMLSRLEYALESLWPVIPEALQAGLGRPQINAIRKLDNAVTNLVLERGISKHNIDALRQVFLNLLGHYDDTEWDLKPVFNEAVVWLSDLFEENAHITRLDLEAILAGRTSGPDAAPSSPLPDLQRHSSDSNASPKQSRTMNQNPAAERKTVLVETDGLYFNPESSPPSIDNHEEFDRPPIDRPSFTKTEWGNADDGIEVLQESAPADIKQLRQRMWMLANQLAERAGLTDQVLVQHNGTGFIMDFPCDCLIQDMDNTSPDQWHITSIWWFLAGISEQFLISHRALAEILPASARLNDFSHALDAGADATNLLLSLVGPMPFEWTGGYFFGLLTNDELNDVNGLIEVSRALHAFCQKNQCHSVWEMQH